MIQSVDSKTTQISVKTLNIQAILLFENIAERENSIFNSSHTTISNYIGWNRK